VSSVDQDGSTSSLRPRQLLLDDADERRQRLGAHEQPTVDEKSRGPCYDETDAPLSAQADIRDGTKPRYAATGSVTNPVMIHDAARLSAMCLPLRSAGMAAGIARTDSIGVRRSEVFRDQLIIDSTIRKNPSECPFSAGAIST
jgi:hypothetical protein